MQSLEDGEGVHHLAEGVCVLIETEMRNHMLTALIADGFTQWNVIHEFESFVHGSLHIAKRIEFARNIMSDERPDPVRIRTEYRTGAADSLSYGISEAFCDRAGQQEAPEAAIDE